MLRTPAVAALAVASALAFPTLASAKAMPLKGQLIARSKQVVDNTGSCSCDWKWYTFGANSGPVSVTATMSTYAHPLAKSWGIRLYLYRGSSLLGWKQTACWTTQKKCVRSITVSSHATQPGIYYTRIEGPGADGVAFTLHVTANLRALHCSRSCTL